MILIESLIVCSMYQCWAVIKNRNKPQWILRFPNCGSQEIKRSHNHDSQFKKKNTQQNQITAHKTAGSFMKTIGYWCFWNNENRQFFHSELFYNKNINTHQKWWFSGSEIFKLPKPMVINKIKYPPQHWSVSVLVDCCFFFNNHQLGLFL